MPYGHDVVADGNTLVPNGTERAVIEQMHTMRARGLTFEATAKELSEQGIPTKTGRSRWTHQAVAGILRRR